MSMTHELESHELIALYTSYCNYYRCIMETYNGKPRRIRAPSFPHDIACNLVRKYIDTYEDNCHAAWMDPTRDGNIAKDTPEGIRKVTVKCFTSDAPISFGPNETFEELYLVDARDFSIADCVRIYYYAHNSHDCAFRDVRVSMYETIEDVCIARRRPRVKFSKLYEQLSGLCLVYSGSLVTLLERT